MARSRKLRKPLKNHLIEWGDHAGETWGEVEKDYILWLVEEKEQELDALKDELNRRELLEEAELPMAYQMIRYGYLPLAQKFHPDKGGDEKKMRELNATYEGVKELLAMQQTTP
jgi:hypothetical protein